MKNGEHLQQLFRTKKRSKYRAVKTVVDGIKFDSKHEAKVYSDLKILSYAGVVGGFNIHTPFRIEWDGELICKYVADFVVHYPDGKTEVWDAKSEKTRKLPVYRLKKKLMKIVNKIDIVEK